MGVGVLFDLVNLSGNTCCFHLVSKFHKGFGRSRWFRGQVDCVLDYEAGDPGSIPVSSGTTDWLFSAGW